VVQQWIEVYGSEKIILSADVKNEMIAISGWQENATITLSDFLSGYLTRGITYVTCTDISTDGMLTGPNVSLYRKIRSSFPSIKIIASGGVSGIQDLHELKSADVAGVIIGKAIYEGRITLAELKAFN
jgi:phosphoribosylformimino-5-aminoimidazole carboxamide ribotide isomerase